METWFGTGLGLTLGFSKANHHSKVLFALVTLFYLFILYIICKYLTLSIALCYLNHVLFVFILLLLFIVYIYIYIYVNYLISALTMDS